MATDHSNHLSNPEVSYEKRDLGARNIILFFAVLFIVGVIIHFLVWGIYGAMEKVVAKMDPQPNPIKPYAETPRAVLLQNTPMVDLNKFAEPRLQSDDVTDMATMNRNEDQVLNGNAWVDQSGVVHLPIEVAKEEILKRGLPTRAAGAPVPTAGATSLAGTAESAKQTTNNAPAAKQ
ncbi:MAG TPA: hypothetical protein VF135_00825 [Terriglobales bacterium]